MLPDGREICTTGHTMSLYAVGEGQTQQIPLCRAVFLRDEVHRCQVAHESLRCARGNIEGVWGMMRSHWRGNASVEDHDERVHWGSQQ